MLRKVCVNLHVRVIIVHSFLCSETPSILHSLEIDSSKSIAIKD